MSKYKLNFKLKQHTPMATLRASELKPKLDKFIIENLLKEQNIRFDFYEELENEKQKFINSHEAFKRKALNPENEVQNNWISWLVGKGLDYKMVVIALSSQDEYIFSSFPDSRNKDPKRIANIRKNLSAEYINNTQYFADNEFIDKPDQHSSIRKGIMSDAINVRIVCLNQDLKNIIELYYRSFFVSTNFGTRQSKGFGCFLPLGIKDSEIIESVKSIPSIIGIFQKLSRANFEIKLKEINKIYSLLKRGQTFGRYQKSKLWEYACINQQVKWEKRKIKMHLINYDPDLFAQLKYDHKSTTHRIDDCTKTPDEYEYKYLRALMGLAEQYEFALDLPGNKKIKVSIKDVLKENPATKVYAIDRFKSPIRFIITDSSIYLITHSIPYLLHHWKDDRGYSQVRKYRFTIDKMKSNKSFTLEVPDHFDLVDFIEKKAGYGKNLKTL